MNFSAWSPSQITGFFQAFPNGSTGAGICLEKGVTTTLATHTKTKKTTVALDGKILTKESASTSFEVIRRFEEVIDDVACVHASHVCEVPVGFGLNASGAAALSLSLALNKALEANLSFEECVKIANESEIACGTGLGGVIAEATGGFCIRKKPGDLNAVEQIPFDKKLSVVFGFLSPIQTKKILADKKLLEKVNEVGGKKMREFEEEKAIDNFVRLSREFVFETGVASEKVKESLELFPECSMCLFGEAVYGITSKPEELEARLKPLTNSTLVSKISLEHAKVY